MTSSELDFKLAKSSMSLNLNRYERGNKQKYACINEKMHFK